MAEHTQDDARMRIDVLTSAIAAGDTAARMAQLYIQRANCYEILGDDANAVGDLVDALERAEEKSTIIQLKSRIALILAKNGQKEQALFWAMGAADQDPSDAFGHYTLGLVCDVCGFANSAAESLQRALALAPDLWDAMRVLGSCQRDNYQLEESIDTLSRYVANNPDDPRGLYELAWSLHVVLPRSEDRIQKAIHLYEEALKRNPSSQLRALIEQKLRDIRSISAE